MADARVAGLDLLRGLAALSVALPHFAAYHGILPDTAEAVSSLAVEVFFVLSGYVLAPQILQCLRDGGASPLGVFLARRWMRTIPPYLVALLAVSLLTHRLGSADFLRYLSYTQNLFRLSNTEDYFAVAWSLSVEEWFYVAFPSLLLGVAWFSGRRDARFAALFGIAFCLVFVVARLLFGSATGWGETVRRVVAFRLDSIGYGFLLFLAVDSLGERLRHAPGWLYAALPALTGTGGFALLSDIAATGDRLAEFLFPFVAASFGGTVILFALRAEGRLRRSPMVARAGLYLGRVSYSTYLFHVILIEVLGTALSRVGMGLQLAVFIVLLFALTTAFYVYVERPILMARPRYRRRTEPVVPGTVTADSG